mgnify:CR=1 FL=1
MLPDSMLVHIGYHKTATSWLQNVIFDDPACGYQSILSFPEIQDLLVLPNALDFDKDYARHEISKHIQSVGQEGMVPVITSERLSGNPHSGGYDSLELAFRLHATLPHSKVLIVIREQTSMILSSYKQHIRMGGRCSLRGYLKQARFAGRIPLFQYKHFEYDRLLGAYLRLFGDSKVLIIPHELLVLNPDAFITKLNEFSESKGGENPAASRRSNVGLSMLSTGMKLGLNRLGARNPNDPCGSLRIPGYNQILITSLAWADRITPKCIRQSMDQAAKRVIAADAGHRYLESNRRTADMTGIDLGEFGYQV